MHRIKHFNIIQSADGYIVHNTRKPFEEGHTHIKSLSYCKRLIYNCLYKRRPRTKNLYLLESHGRITDDEWYLRQIEDLKDSRSKKKEKYVNIQKGCKK